MKAEAGKEGTAERGKQGRRNRRVSRTKQNPVPRKSHGGWTEWVNKGTRSEEEAERQHPAETGRV